MRPFGFLSKLLLIAAATLLSSMNVSHAQQPLVAVDRVPVTAGYPRLNLGYPTENIIDPDIGNIVRLARGFDRTPDFTYSFTHPLARFNDPLAQQGPYGTYNSPVVSGNNDAAPQRPKLNLTVPIQRNPADTTAARPHDPPMNMKFLPAPWHVATQKATFYPKLGVYAHHSAAGPIKGAYVTGITVDGIGHKSGLLPGDVVTSLNGQQLKSASDFNTSLDRLTNPWSMDVWNSHTNRTSTIQSPGSQIRSP